MRIFVCSLVVVCALAASRPAAAQSTFFGIKGGLALADIRVSGAEGFEPSAGAGPVVGGVAGVQMTERARFQVEFLWADRRFSAMVGAIDAEISSRGIEIPVLFVVNGPRDRKVIPLAYAGPQFNIISTVTQTAAGREIDMSDSIKNGDPGLTVGGGLEMPAPRGAFTLDARGTFGFRNLNETSTPTFKSRAFQVLVGYRF